MVSDLPPGTLMEVFVDDHAIALGNVDGTLYAIGNTCPHAGGPLETVQLKARKRYARIMVGLST